MAEVSRASWVPDIDKISENLARVCWHELVIPVRSVHSDSFYAVFIRKRLRRLGVIDEAQSARVESVAQKH